MNPTVRSSIPLIQFNEANNLLFTIVCYIMVTNKQSCYMYHVDSFCVMIYWLYSKSLIYLQCFFQIFIFFLIVRKINKNNQYNEHPNNKVV